MAKLFQVTLPSGMSSVKLDSQGRATVQYTVKNVSARPIDGRAVLISLPQTKPPSGPFEKGWVKVDGKTDRHFDVDKEETFTVKIVVPPKSPAGNYTFRLDTVWVDQPDQGDPGGAVAFAVAAPQPNGHFPLWLIPVLLVVVIGLGVGGWLLMRPHGPVVPDLAKMNLTDAAAALQVAGLTLDPNSQTIESKPEDSGKIVSQIPAPGQKATKGQTVQVTLGAEMVSVPLLVGHTFQEVQGILGEEKLAVGQSKTAPNANFAGGVVFDQTPAPQQVVKSGTAVDVQMTPQMVSVQGVTGQTLGNAILTLQRIGLQVTSFSGDTTQTVVAQNPAVGTSVPVGSSVALSFPIGSCASTAIRICLYSGITARTMVLEQAVRARAIERSVAPQK
jgi:beta-lactam-binding protein with PASTA domain